jgi:hypothetical protein
LHTKSKDARMGAREIEKQTYAQKCLMIKKQEMLSSHYSIFRRCFGVDNAAESPTSHTRKVMQVIGLSLTQGT